MENDKDTQNNKIDPTGQPADGEKPESSGSGSGHRSSGEHSSHHSSGEHSSHHSSGEHSGSHRSSGEHSGSHRSSGEHSGSHRSSGEHSSHRSSSHSKSKHKHHKHSDREKITFANRMKRIRHTIKATLYKYKPKYIYRKLSHRFKKASLQKKFGYIILIISFFLAVGLFTKFVLIDTIYPDDSGGTVTAKTVRTTKPVKPVPPKVTPAYELNDTGLVDNFVSGFIVRLPKINSDKPVAAQININIDAIKEEMKAKYANAGDLNAYRSKYDYSFFSFGNESFVFISLYKLTETADGVSDVSHTYYVYNYTEDKLITDYNLANIYNFSEAQMLNVINDKLDSIGAQQLESTQGLPLSVNKEGKLCAQLSVANGSGGTGPILVPLG